MHHERRQSVQTQGDQAITPILFLMLCGRFRDHTHPFLTVFLSFIKRTSLPIHRSLMSSFTNSTLPPCWFAVSPTTPFSRSRHHHQTFLFARFSRNLPGVSCSRYNISIPNHRISIRTEGYLSKYRLRCTSSAAGMYNEL